VDEDLLTIRSRFLTKIIWLFQKKVLPLQCKNKSPKVGKKTKEQYAEGVFQYGFK